MEATIQAACMVADTFDVVASIVNGFDFDGRPIIYMRPGRENTQKSPRQIEHLIFHL